jgi:probable rRNA maturation factor
MECEEQVLSDKDIASVWNTVRMKTGCADDAVTIRCVSEQEIRELNMRYRTKDHPTNVLTFSYTNPPEHDIALCMDVARREATERNVSLRDYTALLVVHGLLHVTGMDHEDSPAEDEHTQVLEREILNECGFVPVSLSDVY